MTQVPLSHKGENGTQSTTDASIDTIKDGSKISSVFDASFTNDSLLNNMVAVNLTDIDRIGDFHRGIPIFNDSVNDPQLIVGGCVRAGSDIIGPDSGYLTVAKGMVLEVLYIGSSQILDEGWASSKIVVNENPTR